MTARDTAICERCGDAGYGFATTREFLCEGCLYGPALNGRGTGIVYACASAAVLALVLIIGGLTL